MCVDMDTECVCITFLNIVSNERRNPSRMPLPKSSIVACSFCEWGSAIFNALLENENRSTHIPPLFLFFCSVHSKILWCKHPFLNDNLRRPCVFQFGCFYNELVDLQMPTAWLTCYDVGESEWTTITYKIYLMIRKTCNLKFNIQKASI